jgi:DNA-binding transcriptional ArsR family regulator
MIPPDGIGDTETRVLLAATHLHPVPTLDPIVASTGLPRSTVYSALRRLRARGLVDWDDERQGTMRVTITPVPFDSGRAAWWVALLVVVAFLAAGVAGAVAGRILEPELPTPIVEDHT